MDRAAEQLSELAPALAFLLAAVPLAALLDRVGFFGAVAERIVARSTRGVPVVALWGVAAATTVVLNLDTTIVLLTPLYVRLARRTGSDPVGLALVSVLLAGLASSVLPVSNLTTLVAAEHASLSTGAVVAHLAVPSLVATIAGWYGYRRRPPARLPVVPAGTVDGRAIRIGGWVVAALLVAFVGGPALGVPPWVSAVAADLVLVVVTRHVPWRELPVATAAFVAVIAGVVAVATPAGVADLVARDRSAIGLAGTAMVAAAVSGVVNNLPALLVALGPARFGWSGWAWLLGVNAGAVLLPLGALANLLWLRILRSEGLRVGWRSYPGLVVPIALPAFVAAILALVAERAVFG